MSCCSDDDPTSPTSWQSTMSDMARSAFMLVKSLLPSDPSESVVTALFGLHLIIVVTFIISHCARRACPT